MELIFETFGINGLNLAMGIVIFLFCYKYAQGIFDFIEKQTFGTQAFVQEHLKMLFIDIEPRKITYLLLFLSVGLGSLLFILLAILGQWFLGLVLGAMFSFVGFKIPKPFMSVLVNRRMKEYQSQMVDALTLLSNGVRAGLSVPQAIGMVVDEMPEPISQEFNLVLQQTKIGTPLDESLNNLVKRIPIEDNEMFVSSVNILREMGGNLAEVFDTIVEVIRERIRVQQKVDTFIAQGMWQGGAIFAMPFVLAIVFTLSNPGQMLGLVTNPLGIVFLLVAFGLDLIGGYIILKIVRIKV